MNISLGKKKKRVPPQEAVAFQKSAIPAAAFAHDLNNLHTAILSYLELAVSDCVDGETARRSIDTAKMITRQAGEQSKLLVDIYSGRTECRKQHDLREILDEARSIALGTSPVRVTTDLGGDPLMVLANRNCVLNVFVNLLLNARHAVMDRGEVILTASVQDPGTGGQRRLACIEVRDNGCGIPQDRIDSIFSPFVTTKKCGTGLGMTAVRHILEKYDGSISCTSSEAEGTTVRVLFPLV